MAGVNIDTAKLANIMLNGHGTKRELKKKAHLVKAEAEFVFAEHDRPGVGSGEYANSFYVRPHGNHYIVGNDAYTAFWVEFGSHINPHGNKDLPKISVLGYAPLRTAVDIVSSYT